jgi:hypothetical protein
MTGVLLLGWLLTTTMLFKVTLPVLLTLPEKVSVWPGETNCAGHDLVTLMPGVVISGQGPADAVFVTGAAVQLSLPVAVTVLLTEQALVGAVKVAVKFEDAWDARLGTKSTVLGEAWLSTTVTLVKMTLPVFVTVPV